MSNCFNSNIWGLTEAAAEAEALVPIKKKEEVDASTTSMDEQTNSEVAEEHTGTDVANEEASQENGGGGSNIIVSYPPP